MIAGLLLQLILGALVFVIPGTRQAFQGLSALLNAVFAAADYGARFVFGPFLVPPADQPPPLLLAPLAQGATCTPDTAGEITAGYCGVSLGYIFAFRALPAIIFFSALVSLLYRLGVLQIVTQFFAQIFYRTMRLSGAEALSGASNIFVGIESAIVVKPFLSKMTRSELLAILACCFGTTASSVLAVYAAFLKPVFPNILGHLVSASIMAIPACFVLAKILIPETEVPLTRTGIPDEEMATAIAAADGLEQPEQIEQVSFMDSVIAGALEGVRMAVSVAAVLIAVLGLVFLVNQAFTGLANLADSSIEWLRPVGQLFRWVTLQNILGVLFLPLTVLTGLSLNWNEIWQASVLVGQRLLVTEIPAYQQLATLTAAAAESRVFTDRALLILSYALSGFAHLASLGIFVGGISALAPKRRHEIAALGWKALLAGTLATYMIACVAGVFDTGNPGILGRAELPAPVTAPAAPLPVSPSP